MSTTTSIRRQDSPHTPWWVVLIEGIAAIIVGLLLLVNPAATTLFLVQFLGFYWFFTGIIDIVTIFVDRRAWGWKLFSGIIGILAGLFIIQSPLWSAFLVPTTLVWLLGFGGIFIGISWLFRAFQGAGWGAGILGALSILFGFLLLSRPIMAALATPFVFGILGVVFGIAAFFTAFRIRSAEKAARERAAQDAAAAKTQAAKAQSAPPAAAPLTAAPPVQVTPALPAPPTPVSPAATAAVGIASVGAMAEAMTPAAAEPVAAAEPPVEAASAAAAATAFSLPTDQPEAVVPEPAAEATAEEEPTDAKLDFGAKFAQGLDYIEGIGPVYAEKLREIGLGTLNDLLERGASSKGHDEIAELSGISGKLILKWVNHVDLIRVKGVGSEYADLLEAAGVDTVVELAQRNPANLFEKMLATNAEEEAWCEKHR